MAQDVSRKNVDLEVGGGAEDVNSPPPDTSKRTDENDSEQESILAYKLLQALAKNDASEVRKLLEEDHYTVRKKYGKFRDDCEELKKKAEKREERGFHYDFRCSCGSNSSKQSSDEQNLNWIKILSNPMFIALEWQWRTNSDSECQCQEDVIDSSLLDAYLLSEMSSFKRYDSRDVYKKSAEGYETFATDVLEEASQSELYKIMDVKGEGCLLEENPPKHRNYIESLSFLKSAVNKTRKKAVRTEVFGLVFSLRRENQD
ncbi:uncharacterized protein LOC111329299 [Stylophora pistillata]|uniref:uncharacterized protein LOC111329299 n=1 Tax=Stylophora pistillata TaxID=50429 RepID=UPI000C04D6EF|nr:uncharacterized protein LOC111329299 [Stylophora pistillata]